MYFHLWGGVSSYIFNDRNEIDVYVNMANKNFLFSVVCKLPILSL